MNRPKSAEVDLSDFLSTNDLSKRRPFLQRGGDAITEKLSFEIDHMFCVGSPVGMFLLLSGKSIKPFNISQDHSPDTSRPVLKALYNIYHAYDPVAHRLEPLFSHR